MSNNITLRPYQIGPVREVKNIWASGVQTAVLASCPGSGKTTMGALITDEILQSGEAVVILAHGTNVIKDQWHERMEQYGIQHPNLHIILPHGPNRNMEGFLAEIGDVPVGLVIIDEAHEFYFAEKMVQGILKATNPKRVLCLTGTPSKFVRESLQDPNKYGLVFLPAVQVYSADPGKYICDTTFTMVRSHHSITQDDYNYEGEVKTTFTWNPVNTLEDMESLVDSMLKRLKMPVGQADPESLLGKLGRSALAQKVFGTLDKTLIACANIRHAQDVHRILVDKGVRAVVSESEGDKDSEEFNAFKEDPAIQVLVVVRRGILGFDMAELINVVDMTGSRNIDRIYQLYARVLRPHGGKEKFYFRMCSNLNPMVDQFYVQAALCLSNGDFLSRWNGSNLSGLDILIPKRMDSYRKEAEKSRAGRGKKRHAQPDSKEIEVPEDLFFAVMGLQAFQEYHLEVGEGWTETARCRFGEVVRSLTGKTFIDPDGNKQAIIDWIMAHPIDEE